MEFTYKAYINLIRTLREYGYEFCSYNNVNDFERTVILRHDIDFDLKKALEMAVLENKLGVKSTYFVLLSTDFYNIFSRSSYEILKKILLLGHDIGLHFDEQRYAIKCIDDLNKYVQKEALILNELLVEKVGVASMHRPSKLILENNVQFDNLINSYSSHYFNDMKYMSDSRMHWREDILNIVKDSRFDRFHILIHPFWYTVDYETIEYKFRVFLNDSIYQRYEYINNNFRNLEEIIKKGELR